MTNGPQTRKRLYEAVGFVASVVLVSSLAVGCAGSSPVPTSPGGSLPGTWTLESIQPAGEAEQARPSGATYTVTFTNGALSTHADCNSCSGPYTLTGQTLVAGPLLACTRAACPTMAFENTYTKLLGGESTVSLSGRTLVMVSPRGVLRFKR
jgi:heat shock protein HslJ